MAAILTQPFSKAKAGFYPVKIDMTPMVDLGFLLITFFIFTASLMEPTVAKLVMPKEDGHIIQPVYEKTLLTAVLDKGDVFVYEGAFEKALARATVKRTNYDVKSGLGNTVRQKQKSLQPAGLKEDMTVLIKPTATASYQDVMNALDEMLINGVSRYAIVDPSAQEKAYLASVANRR